MDIKVKKFKDCSHRGINYVLYIDEHKHFHAMPVEGQVFGNTTFPNFHHSAAECFVASYEAKRTIDFWIAKNVNLIIEE